MDFSPDGKYLAVGIGKGNAIVVFDVETGKELDDLLAADDEVRKHLSEEEIRGAFDVRNHCRNVGYLLRRAGVEE